MTGTVLDFGTDHSGSDDWYDPSADVVHTEQPTEPERVTGQLRFARRFARRHAGEFLHVYGIGWHHYDGMRWSACDDGAEDRAAVQLVKDGYNELAELDSDARKALIRDLSTVHSAAGLRGILDIAKSQLPCPAADLDAEAELLNTPGGTIELSTDSTSGHNPADRLSKVTRAQLRPMPAESELATFLEKAQPDPDMRAFLARSLGSTLLGRVREHVLLIWHGSGANGKGTLRDAVRHALGDYAIEVPPEILLANKHGQQSLAPERMRLKGARLAFCSEISQGAKLDEAVMKRLTGGDPVTAKLLYENPIEFDPSHTLVMLTNFLPQVRGDDPAVWRRLMIVPFDVVVPAAERDPDLPAKLKAEADAVFAWLWAGWQDYQRQGLNPPQAVLDATERYQRDSDPIARWLADESAVLVGPSVGSTGAAQLYTAFMDWQRAEGESTPMTNKEFTAAMQLRRFEQKRGAQGRYWPGILVTQRSHDR